MWLTMWPVTWPTEANENTRVARGPLSAITIGSSKLCSGPKFRAATPNIVADQNFSSGLNLVIERKFRNSSFSIFSQFWPSPCRITSCPLTTTCGGVVTVFQITASPSARCRQFWRRTRKFFQDFLQFYVYDLRFKAGGLTTFLTVFWTLVVTNDWRWMCRQPPKGAFTPTWSGSARGCRSIFRAGRVTLARSFTICGGPISWHWVIDL